MCYLPTIWLYINKPVHLILSININHQFMYRRTGYARKHKEYVFSRRIGKTSQVKVDQRVEYSLRRNKQKPNSNGRIVYSRGAQRQCRNDLAGAMLHEGLESKLCFGPGARDRRVSGPQNTSPRLENGLMRLK